MKYTIILLALFISNLTFSQMDRDKIYGTWIKVKSEMKDGSRLFHRLEKDSTFAQYAIRRGKYCKYGSPVFAKSNDCLDFSLSGNIIVTSPTTGYQIEKVTVDSLIISENFEGETNDKLRRYYLLNQNVLISKFKESNKDIKNVIATKFCTPTCSLPIGSEIFKAFNSYSNFRLIGSLKIFPTERKINTQITFSTRKDSSKINIIKKIINNSFEKWDLSNFNEYESIEIPFVFESKYTGNYKGLNILFFTKDLNEFENIGESKLSDMQKGSEYFEKGLKAYQEKKFIKAIEYFTESYRADPKNLDALYNKAAVYYESGDLQNACSTWKEIIDLGQVIGKTFFNDYCKK